MGESKETRVFEAEVSQVLRLMVHSMYSNREVFLRELISNGSDAIDKLRFEALSDESVYEGQTDLKIEVEIDEEARTLTVRDSGIGMNRQEVAENIGTIARSGTRQFLEQLTGDQKKDSGLIGQFGVGFYSAFIVADRVVLTTRRAGEEEGVRWESTGEGEYTLEAVEKPERGTEILLHLREDADEFLKSYRLEQIIRRYSDHISFPIHLIEMKEVEKESEGEEDGEKSEKETELVRDSHQVNQASALWTRSESEISEEEYQGFYKHVAHAFDEPLTWTHSKVEGMLKFTMLLYVPTEKPFDMALPGQDKVNGVKLYIKRVFVLDDAEMFLPRYLRFVRGVIDSDDLPLNVSRELLQDNRVVATIKKAAVKRVLRMLEELSEDEEKYQTFWGNFGRILKEGVIEDRSRQKDVAPLLRFASTSRGDGAQVVSLSEYKEALKEGQKAIYYISADSYEAGMASPHLEIFKKKGVEVLVLSDTVDEWLVQHLTEFEELPLHSVDRGGLDLSELGKESDEAEEEGASTEEAETDDERPEGFEEILTKLKDGLTENVKDVRLSRRLTDSPSCLVREDWEISARMRRILTQAGEEVPSGKPSLELNPDHPLVASLKEKSDEDLLEWGQLFYDQALLSEGGVPDSPALFVKRLNTLMARLAGTSA